MSSNSIGVKLVVGFVLVGSYFLLPKYGFTSSLHPLINHLLYPLSHANIWHLAANLFFLWLLPCKLYILTTFVCSVLCSFLPCFSSEPTMGFSGVLFAIVGMSWGKVGRFKDMLWKNRWYLVLPFFIPHVNAFIHLYCLLAGYMCGLCVRK